MKTNLFGSTDVTVSELCLATANFSRLVDQGQAFSMLDAFRAAGGNFFETTGLSTDSGFGRNVGAVSQEFLSRWFNSRAVPRREIVIAARLALTPWMAGHHRSYADFAQATIQSSLRRIGTDYVDFLVIEWEPSLLPLRGSLDALDAVVASGSARHVIVAGFPTEHLDIVRTCLTRCLAGVQLDYSVIHRPVFERGASAFCRANKLGFVARAPLAGGHLVDWPAQTPGSFAWRMAGDPFIATSAHAAWPALSGIGRVHDAAPAQIALAWVLAQPDVTSVRISTSSPGQLRELIAATQLELAPGELAQLQNGGAADERSHAFPLLMS